jgi:NCAIR mutase (PurE)-related protein
MDITEILKQLQSGAVSLAQAEAAVKSGVAPDLGYAKPDLLRRETSGAGEVIYCEGKTKEQVLGIMQSLLEQTKSGVLATRAARETFDYAVRTVPFARYNEAARIITAIPPGAKKNKLSGSALVLTAGTSDIPVAEEAAATLEFLGAAVTRVFDAGVAGIHRLLRHTDALRQCDVLIVAAGMEGALPSVAGGLTAKPVIAVPTSVGYGASFGGITALLAMLNSCASGVTVVNIDNGFGAAYAAFRILLGRE